MSKRSYLHQHRVTSIKLGVFVVVMSLIFLALAVVFSKMTFTSDTGYHAVFANASGMTDGSTVRIAGVPVGRVTKVEVGSDNLAHVDFDVESKQTLMRSTRAAIRYEDLVGNRYLELMPGPGSAQRLPGDGTIPKAQTAPALDLDQLLGGFKPILKGLNAQQSNQLSAALIQIFQGQGGSLVTLLNSTGDFTKSLAERDALIGGVINNLNAVLKTITDKGNQFDVTVDQLQQLISGLAADRDPIAGAVPRLAGATGQLAQLLQAVRPDFAASVRQGERVAGNINAGKDDVQWVFDNLPDAYRSLARVGAYGPFLNVYICNVRMKFTTPDGQDRLLQLPGSDQKTGRCAR
ncbi:MAG: MCE family protein [Mycobacteriaceae bacterium]|nr:MCE family protein [Mycobacteriaceae bacterium]